MSKASPFVRYAAVVCIVAAALLLVALGVHSLKVMWSRILVGDIVYFCDVGTARDVERILKDHPDLVNARDGFGDTPLYWAASFGNTGVVAVLIKHGADVNAAEPQTGFTPLMCAVTEESTDVIGQLIAAGADVNLFDIDNETALHYAARSEDLSMVKLLVEAGADVNACKAGGETPLSMLEHSKDLSKSDREKPTFKAIVKYLKEHGAKVNCKHTAVSTSP